MKAVLLGIAGLLLVGNLATTTWLLKLTNDRGKGEPQVSPQVVMQAEKLWQKAQEFQAAYEEVVATAQYPSDKDKKEQTEALRGASLDFQLFRIVYLRCHENPTRTNVGAFVEAARDIFFVRSFEKGEMQRDYSWKTTPYGNTSKLDALNNEYWVLAQTLLKDIK